MSGKKKGRGRPNKYETHVKPYLDRIPAWRRQGLTERQVAEKLGVSESSFCVYKNNYVELLEALKKGKEELVETLEESLYTRGMGGEYKEETVYVEEVGGITRKWKKVTTRHVPPDTGALAFALKNLAPERWRDRKEQEVSMAGELSIAERGDKFRKYLKNELEETDSD